MSKKEVLNIISKMVEDYLEGSPEGLSLYHLEYVKEGPDKILRVYIDKTGKENDYVSTEDCEKVSKYLSERLDETDPIPEAYVLEVSSPGLDRVLIKEEHFRRYTGELIEVSLFKPLEGKKGPKKIEGILKSYNNGDITIAPISPEGKELEDIDLKEKDIAKVNLAVVI